MDLEIMDYFTGKARNVKSLSGGESFKAALALALGLSDVIQSYAGGVVVETMFVDEGFGSLDKDSLEQAVHTVVVFHLNGAVVHIESGVWFEPGTADHLLDHLRVSPEGWGKGSGTGEVLVVLGDCIKAHKSTHRAAGNECMAAVFQGAVTSVNVTFEHFYIPVHGDFAVAGDRSGNRIIVIKRGILF